MKKYVFLTENQITNEMISQSELSKKALPKYGNYFVLPICYNNFQKDLRNFLRFDQAEAEALITDIENGKAIQTQTIKVQETLEFAAKTLPDGSKLYANIFGIKETVLAGETKDIIIPIPYERCFFNEAEIINAEVGDEVDFKFSANIGTEETPVWYSVYQHGHTVNLPDGYYRKHSDKSAELNSGLAIVFGYKNGTATDKVVRLNITLHEALL